LRQGAHIFFIEDSKLNYGFASFKPLYIEIHEMRNTLIP